MMVGVVEGPERCQGNVLGCFGQCGSWRLLSLVVWHWLQLSRGVLSSGRVNIWPASLRFA